MVQNHGPRGVLLVGSQSVGTLSNVEIAVFETHQLWKSTAEQVALGGGIMRWSVREDVGLGTENVVRGDGERDG